MPRNTSTHFRSIVDNQIFSVGWRGLVNAERPQEGETREDLCDDAQIQHSRGQELAVVDPARALLSALVLPHLTRVIEDDPEQELRNELPCNEDSAR